MSEIAEALFETLRQGCARLLPPTAALLAEWAHACDSNPATGATHILKAAGKRTRFVDGKLRAEMPCRHCGAEFVAERGSKSRPTHFFTGGEYYAGGGNPKSVVCEACGKITRPSALVGVLYPDEAERLEFLQKHCRSAKPQEKWRYVARLDGKVVKAETAEAAIDAVVQQAYPDEIELCLLLSIEEPTGVAELDLPFLPVALSAVGDITVLGWHGQRPTVQEQTRHAAWHRQHQAKQRVAEAAAVENFRAQLRTERSA
jgi:hypothetical protein